MCTEIICDLPIQNHTTHRLSSEEIANPLLVFRELFNFGHLPVIRQMMWEWFSATVTGAFPKDLQKSERKDIVLMFEFLEKLVEAAYLIDEKRKKNQLNVLS